MFEKQPNHNADPRAALKAIGAPTATPAVTSTPVKTETVETPLITTVAASRTQASPGFGSFAALAGLISCVLVARRHNTLRS